MSKTLSVLILENFVINEGPKWDKFKKGVKKGAKKVGQGAVIAATLGSVALGGVGGTKISDANRNYDRDTYTALSDSYSKRDELRKNHGKDIRDIDSDKNTTPETKESLRSQLKKNFDRDMADNLISKTNKQWEATIRRDRAHEKGNQALAGAGGLAGIGAVGAVALAAGSKGEKKKQEKKSLKERLELVKSGMYLNEEPLNEAVILAALAATIGSLGLAGLLTGGLAKLAIKMETKQMITDFANSLRDDKDSEVTVNVMNNIVKKNGSKEEKEQFKKLYNELLSLISRGKLELTVTTDKEEVLDKRVHNVTGFLQKDEENKKINKLSDEKSKQAYLLIKRMYEIYKSVSDQILQPNKQTNKSLKERLELVKSGMFLNEESADIIALRNKIRQGLILLPGLKGSAADKMEDSIRSWEDQINELEKR